MDEEIVDNSDGEETTENDLPSFDKELKRFIDHITSLAVTLKISMEAISTSFEATLETLKEFEKENIIFKEIDGEKTLLVKADSAKRFEELNKQLRSYGLAHKTIPRSYIMSLISQYDAFLGRLLRVIFLTKPELLNSSDRKLTFSQLVDFDAVKDAKEFILEKEIESVLRKSHTEHFQWMENKFKMKLTKDLSIWSDFVEVTERRNLFVHTGGIVSSQYLNVCKKHDVFLDSLKAGEEVDVSEEYFENAYDVIYEIGYKLAHVLWRKFIPDDLEKADRNLISIGYDTLYEEDYKLTKMIFNFATQTIKKHGSDEDRRIMVINRALAYKWSGNDEKTKNIIQQEDWSATRARFRMAEAVLLDNFETAYKIMREISGNENELGREEYRQWPLFKVIKKEEKFREIFEEVFDEPYNKIEQEETILSDDAISNDMLTLEEEVISE